MVKFVEPATSYAELESLVANAEAVLQAPGPGLPRARALQGDISFAAAKCYDLELWAPGQQAGSKFPPAAISRTSRPAGPGSAIVMPMANPSSCTPSTDPAWPCHADGCHP
jgi:hypothetical protein